MQTIILGSYILVWPAITLGMLGMISYAVVRDYREAKRTNMDMV
ncbi:MAG TPA: putative transporter small subunit [Candidatus Pseudomonas excrementavium]|nr:putative transporter small subunit [Halopseudomonas bauzanensis]HIZ50726.1 putative transporter small subunit [Candidatus Pseudomonas excrementavium]